MKNDTRNGIFTGHTAQPHHLVVLICTGASLALSPLSAWADVPTPPPTAPHSAGFPSEQALINRGYDPKTGIWQVEETNRGKPTVKKEGGNITGTQGRNVTVTGKYGEKVNLHTSVNQTAGISKIQTAFAAANIGSSAVRAVEQDNGAFSSAFSNREYGKAAMAAARSIGNFFDGLFTGGAGGYIAGKFEGDNVFNRYKYEDFANSAQSLYNYAKDLQVAQAQAERDGNLAEALAAAQAKKIAQEAAEAAARDQQSKEAAQEQLKQGKQIWVLEFYYGVAGKYTGHKFVHYTNKEVADRSGAVAYYKNGKIDNYAFPEKEINQYFPKTIPYKAYTYAFLTWSLWDGKQDLPTAQPTPDNILLTQTEIANILRRMLESNQTNHAELMRQLSMMGNVVSESTTNITYNQTTAKSAPYTPQGSRQAQQTEATVHKDGSITTNVIPRPDLKPDSSQAPTREQVVPNTPGENVPQNPNGQNQNPSTSEQNQQRQEFCKQNPTSAYCQDLGNTDYEDLSIPTNAIDMTLRPLDIFSTDGICPAPLSFEFGPLGKFEISYDFLCKVARLIRPIAILVTMISCSFTAFAAIKEL